MSNINYSLYFISQMVRNSFNNLKHYYNEIAPMIKSEKERIIENNKKLQEDLKKASKEEQYQYYDYYADDWYMSKNVEISFCNSILVSIYTIIEKYFNIICDELESEKSLPIKYTDLNGQGVTRAKMYLEKLAGITFDTKESKFLSGINAVRNIIAHEDGELYDISKLNLGKIKNITEQAKGIIIKEVEFYDETINTSQKIPSKIEIHLEFIEYCLEQGILIFKSLISKIKML